MVLPASCRPGRTPIPDPWRFLSVSGPPPSYKPSQYWYVVGVLMLAYILSYVDRSILTLLVEPIRTDMGFSDFEISLLHGFAFAVLYSVMGYPIGRYADSHHRVGVVVVGVAVWSLMTAACGIVKNFIGFFLARMGVGIGEASLNPAAYSIITDYFPAEKLSRGISTYVMGTYMGFGISYLVGAGVLSLIGESPGFELPLIGRLHAWQLAFFIVAAPGALVLLLLLTVPEPYRKGRMQGNESQVKPVPFRDFRRFVAFNWKTFACHALGFGCLGVLVNGMALWTPTFLTRTFGWDIVKAGTAYGLVLLIFGAGGIYCGGWIADRLHARGHRSGAFTTAAWCAVGTIVPATLFPLMDSAQGALVVMVPMVFFSAAPWGLAVSSLQQFTPNELRGQVSALLYLFPVNLIGIGLGPSLVALITERVFENPADLRYSMAFVGSGASILAACALFSGIRPFSESLIRTGKGWDMGFRSG